MMGECLFNCILIVILCFFFDLFQFNIAIQDHPDVSAETKKALQISQYETITERLPLCVEISLQTVGKWFKVILMNSECL